MTPSAKLRFFKRSSPNEETIILKSSNDEIHAYLGYDQKVSRNLTFTDTFALEGYINSLLFLHANDKDAPELQLELTSHPTFLFKAFQFKNPKFRSRVASTITNTLATGIGMN